MSDSAQPSHHAQLMDLQGNRQEHRGIILNQIGYRDLDAHVKTHWRQQFLLDYVRQCLSIGRMHMVGVLMSMFKSKHVSSSFKRLDLGIPESSRNCLPETNPVARRGLRQAILAAPGICIEIIPHFCVFVWLNAKKTALFPFLGHASSLELISSILTSTQGFTVLQDVSDT